MPMKSLLAILMFLAFPIFALLAQENNTSGNPKVEVYYFHATMRCPTCLAIEEQTRKTLDENFAEELKAGSVKLVVMNLEEIENEALVKKFEIGWSSLILYVPESGKTVNLTEDAFANARSHPDEFRGELQKAIKELM